MPRVPIAKTVALKSRRPSGVEVTLTPSDAQGHTFEAGSHIYLVATNNSATPRDIKILRLPSNRFKRDPSLGRDSDNTDSTAIDFTVGAWSVAMTGRLSIDGFVQTSLDGGGLPLDGHGLIWLDMVDAADPDLNFAVVVV